MLWLRPAVMAGKFYPARKQDILSTIDSYVSFPEKERKEAFGVMVPHAGYNYSGRIAAEAFDQIKVPETVIILCPNHTGRGPTVSVWSEGVWDTPLGRIHVAEKLAKEILTALRLRDGDMLAHQSEHAVEVELPLLQYFQPKLKIIPIVLASCTFAECVRIATALKIVIERHPKGSILLVASTDMSHYVSAVEALVKDEMALSKIDQLNPKGLFEIVVQEDISMCGFIPATVVLETCLQLGAKSSRRLSYCTSGETNQDYASVVAYANAVFA